jgi:RNase adapter protein RapZ
MERFVIVSGLSGAGKTTALHALEEFGYFTADNLPPELWKPLLDGCQTRGLNRVAVVTDARTRFFLDGLEAALTGCEALVKPELVFLDADDDVLIRRYGLTRRSHPLQEPTLLGDLREERRVLHDIRNRSETTIDTSSLSAKGLVERLRGLYGADAGFQVTLFSFGFKHGAPRDADLVLDARSLPNPFYDPLLKDRSGLEGDVAAYVFSVDGTAFYHQMREFAESTLEQAQRSGRTNYAVAVGCTGGYHRSVAVTEALSRDLSAYRVQVSHRDLDLKEGGA